MEMHRWPRAAARGTGRHPSPPACLAGGPPGAVLAAVSARGGGGQAAREQRVRLVAVLEGGEEQRAALLRCSLSALGMRWKTGSRLRSSDATRLSGSLVLAAAQSVVSKQRWPVLT